MLSVIKAKAYTANRNLIMVQSKLFSPSYAGPGKWIIYNPDTKKAHLAVGKDKLPDIIPLLVEASLNPIPSSQIIDSKLKRLVETGLLVDCLDFKDVPSSRTFIERYHRAVYNFPFRDYHDKDWAQKDQETMTHYAKLWSPPPLFTERYGEKIFLGDISESELEYTENEITLGFISSLLRSVFGPIDIIGEYPNQIVRKISPSGGGKHPTEAVIFLNKDYEHVKKGAYTYDVENHALVKNHSFATDSLKIQNEESISILIRARVERPMWRYREIRSYRAVMIDAGHVIENIRQICEYKGLYTKISKAPEASNQISDFDWVKEPHFCSIYVSPKRIYKENEETLTHKDYKDIDFKKSRRYITNPCLYFTFEQGKLMCNIVWPTVRSINVDYKDFEVLTHCLPSRRGDRDISEKGIFKEFLISKTNFEKLIKSHALIPEDIAKKLYRELILWANHNWYLNFLVHCEVKNTNNQVEEEPFRKDVIMKDPRKLFIRRTTRKFSDRQISLAQFNRILKNAIPDNESDSLELIVNVKNVEGVLPGLYIWKKSKLYELGSSLSSSQVRSLVIGQEWAGSGAIDIWIRNKIDFDNPALYEMAFIKLGMVGQRICITCTEEGLGTFMTPAVKDQETFDALGVNNSMDTVLYHLTIGYRG